MRARLGLFTLFLCGGLLHAATLYPSDSSLFLTLPGTAGLLTPIGSLENGAPDVWPTNLLGGPTFPTGSGLSFWGPLPDPTLLPGLYPLNTSPGSVSVPLEVVAEVPEPATWILVLAGAGGLAALWLRRREVKARGAIV
jgi:hypothetical protein